MKIEIGSNEAGQRLDKFLRKLLKDVVYTEVYDQRRIDDWSESMHKTVTELAHREIKKDKRLANWAVDHIVESDKTYNLFKGGRKK